VELSFNVLKKESELKMTSHTREKDGKVEQFIQSINELE
jgi:hypothetical protein